MFDRGKRGHPGQHLAQQGLDLVHQVEVVITGAIPLQQGELRVVLAPGLAVAEYLADLVDGAAARRQQALHGKFGRGVQVQRPLAVHGRAVPGGAKAAQRRVRGAGDRQGRRVDLEDITPRKEGTDARQQFGTQFQGIEGCRWPPVVT